MGGLAFAQPSDPIEWLTLETRHTMIQYQSLKDLEKFSRKIKYKAEDFSLKQLFAASESDDFNGRLIKKVDALFERVQEILDMRKKMNKVTIHIYKDKNQLHGAFLKIYMRPCNIRAWYEYRFNTVYINVDDVHEGMLAHELAHGIIDHYLLVRPPPATAEILARYVDSHLK